jgi:hypothetical protein
VPLSLVAGAPGFAAAFDRLVASARETMDRVDAVAAAIVEDVQRRGDAALFEHTLKLDGVAPGRQGLRIAKRDIEAAWKSVPARTRRALEVAAGRIEAFHRRQLPAGAAWTDGEGIRLGWRWTPVDSAGIYVPGGRAAYPSSVLMNAIPARVAGVERIAMVVPAPRGELDPLVLAAARLAQDHCDAIDLNCGCPQGIARRGHYGAFLLDEPELIEDIVRTLVGGLRIPVFVKMRVLPQLERTLSLVKRLEAAGCSLLTIHGRTREQKTSCAADWPKALPPAS